MKRILLAILIFPFAVVLIAWDIAKLPVVLMLFFPIALFMRALDWCKGQEPPFTVWEFLKDVSTLGCQMVADMWRRDAP